MTVCVGAVGVCVVLAGSVAAGGDRDGTSASEVRALRVEPEAIVLEGASRSQQLLVTAERSGGGTFDATRACAMITRDLGVAHVVGTTVCGVADGATELVVRLDALERSVPVQVRGFGRYPPVHFGNDIVPLLTKLGCNSGGCHGKATGQNGFKLSVFGFDPAADYDSIVKESRGRRVFPASPEHSLILLKPAARIPHGGGHRLDIGSAEHQVLLEWLRQGMPVGASDAPHLVGLRVSPGERTLGLQSSQQILSTALYSDGSRRDVTAAAAYTSNSDGVAEVRPGGRIETGRVPGQAAITVNYMGQVAAVEIRVPRSGAPDPYPAIPRHNAIDELVWTKLRELGIVPSELCDDLTFLRRLYLDAIGTLPTPNEVRGFLKDSSADRRRRAIDAVLARDEFADYWALQWADILLVDRNKLGDRGAYEFHRWLREQFARNRPYDQWVRELITASGSSSRNGPVNFYRAVRSTEDVTKSVSQAFLGIRLECAQCHHHPFEKWSQSDFYGLAGFFNGMERKPLRADVSMPEGTTPELIYHAGYRETRMPYSSALVPTRPPGGAPPTLAEHVDPRQALADWMTGPGNPWFARLVANRLWKHCFGRGLVEPEDDLRSTNPPTNAALLDYLAAQVVARGYDLKAVMRLILSSRVYQLSAVPNEANADDTQGFSHYYEKRLPAEVLLDAIAAVTGVPDSFPGKPPGTRAIALWDNRMPSYFLDIFGRPERTSPCECGRSSEPTMAQALHLMNAPELSEKVANPAGRVARLIQDGATSSQIVDELCLAALGRPPSAKEAAVARQLFEHAPPRQAAEDFLWTLLNSYDFLFVR